MPTFGNRYVDLDLNTGGVYPAGEWWRRAGGPDPVMTSTAWSTSNLAVYLPIYIPGKAMPITQLGLLNGASVSGNFDLGIYLPDSENKPGSRLVSSGSTAQAGTQVLQFVTFAAKWVSGLAFLACVFDNTSATIRQLAALTTNLNGPVRYSIFTQATAFPLPATATPSSAGVVAVLPQLIATVT